LLFVERDAELAVLKRSLADCRNGLGGVVMITGPVGTGKTELMRIFARQAVQAGATFLSATGSRAERDLPLGVLGQLFVGADLPAEQAQRVSRLLDDGALTARLHEYEYEAESVRQVTAPVLHGLTMALLGLSERVPLLIGVDDVHFADVPSLQCLLYLVRRAVRARVLVVVNEATRARQPRPLFRADLLSQPHCRQLRIGPLSRPGVASVVTGQLGLADPGHPATAFHEVSGGNPLLLNALIEDSRAAGRQAPEPIVGDAFGQAVLSCLYRSDTTMFRLARVLAILGEPAPPALTGELVGLDQASTIRAMDTAAEGGLLTAGRFRHPRARAAVLDAMGSEERADLHERTAYLLYKNGAPAETVARHKIAAHHVGASWSVPVLREAADQALEKDDTSLALDCLRLAEQASEDAAERATIKSALVRAQWRVDPATAERHIADLLEATAAGHLTGRHAVALAHCLLWYGRADEAADVLDRVDRTMSPDDVDTAIARYSAGAHLAFTCPSLADRVRHRPRPRPSTVGAATGNLALRAANVVDTLLAKGFTEEILGDAERILQQARLDDPAGHAVLVSLEALTYADCLETAAFWCDPMLRDAESRKAPTWYAILSAIRAMISFRQGDLAAAERHARAALSHISPRSLGVLMGIPLSVLVHTATRDGRYEQALTHLNVPVPAAMFQTRFGLAYLRARGHYYLAQGNYQAAAVDFEACRDLMLKWRLDLPGIVPWRTDLAEACLGLGQADRARELTEAQLMLLGPDNARTRGISLRVLAAAQQVEERPAILRQAVEVLRDSGDKLELAYALDDLSYVEASALEPGRARLTVGRSVRPAEYGRGQPLRLADTSRSIQLSDAERRVAELAAQGHTNRQIARKLYVTVSTVEQHLTRVYRKLHVNRRTDLPVKLLRDSA
jgi:DNA-binding CsgD family transcriptional regulator